MKKAWCRMLLGLLIAGTIGTLTFAGQEEVSRLPENSDPGLQVRLELDRGPPALYRQGEHMTVRFEVRAKESQAKDAFIWIYSIDVHNHIRVIYPNRFQPQTKIQLGQQYTIPAPEDSFLFVVEGDPGQESIHAVATFEPLTFFTAAMQGRAIRGVGETISEDAGEFVNRGLSKVLAITPPEEWGACTVTYRLLKQRNEE